MTSAAPGPAPTPAGELPPWQFYDGDYSIAPGISLRPDGSAALLVVDMQYHDASRQGGFNRAIERTRPGSLAAYERRVEEIVVPSIARLLAWFRARNLPVIFLTLGSDFRDYRDVPRTAREMTLELERTSGIEGILWTGDPGARILAELEPRPGEPIVPKRTAGAFATSNLQSVLAERGITELVVTGVTTSCCVESTAREAADRGFGVVLVSDACAEYDIEAHEATLRTFHTNFGRVVAHPADIEKAIEEGIRL